MENCNEKCEVFKEVLEQNQNPLLITWNVKFDFNEANRWKNWALFKPYKYQMKWASGIWK